MVLTSGRVQAVIVALGLDPDQVARLSLEADHLEWWDWQGTPHLVKVLA